jgi:zona occludens toxin (predicted ATPase)
MIKEAQALYQDRKVKFFLILVPLVLLGLVALFVPALRTLLASQINKMLGDAKVKDAELKGQQDAAQAAAAAHKEKADALGKQNAGVQTEEDEDWNKKV